MGSTNYSARDWEQTATINSTKSVDQIYKSRTTDPKNNPLNIVVREARDSDVHPETIPVFIAVDGTGSMGSLSKLVASKIGLVFEALIKSHEEGKLPYPQVAVALYRDVRMDYSDIYQLTQFESDTTTLMAQVEKFAAVGTGGGGNSSESNGLVWYTAMTKMVHDHYVRRGKKGFLFTIGDEEVPPDLTYHDIKRVFGEDVEAVPTNAEMLARINPEWEVYHLMVAQGDHMSYSRLDVINSWQALLGEHALVLENTDDMVEMIASTILLSAGLSIDDAIAPWSGSTQIALRSSLGRLATTKSSNSNGIVRL